MKIILSRKGFDSSAGGHASPVLSDATMVSLPIPSRLDELAYADIAMTPPSRDRRSRGDNGTSSRALPAVSSYAELIRAPDAGARLAGGAHLDPDLLAAARPRPVGWRPTFGQVGAAGGHLRNARVGVGDLFLFFGWFRHTEDDTARLRFIRGAGFH